MNPEQQRIAIAEACGWNPPHSTERDLPYWTDKHGLSYGSTQPPDYLNDLNAMHKAVMSLSFEDRIRFRQELQWIVAPETKPSGVSGIKLMGKESYDKWFFATAAQRARAFLETLGLWDNGSA